MAPVVERASRTELVVVLTFLFVFFNTKRIAVILANLYVFWAVAVTIISLGILIKFVCTAWSKSERRGGHWKMISFLDCIPVFTGFALICIYWIGLMCFIACFPNEIERADNWHYAAVHISVYCMLIIDYLITAKLILLVCKVCKWLIEPSMGD